MAEFAPIPSASERTATAVNRGFLARLRSTNFKSKSKRSISFLPMHAAGHAAGSYKYKKGKELTTQQVSGYGTSLPKIGQCPLPLFNCSKRPDYYSSPNRIAD